MQAYLVVHQHEHFKAARHITYPSKIFGQFCVALEISIARHSVLSTPAKTYKYSFYPRTINGKIAIIKEQQN